MSTKLNDYLPRSDDEKTLALYYIMSWQGCQRWNICVNVIVERSTDVGKFTIRSYGDVMNVQVWAEKGFENDLTAQIGKNK